MSSRNPFPITFISWSHIIQAENLFFHISLSHIKNECNEFCKSHMSLFVYYRIALELVKIEYYIIRDRIKFNKGFYKKFFFHYG